MTHTVEILADGLIVVVPGPSDHDIIEILIPGIQGPRGSLIPRAQVVATAATLAPDLDVFDAHTHTAQAGPLFVANPVSTEAFGHHRKLMISLEDNGTSQALSFDTKYRGVAVPLPAFTTVGKGMYLGFMYEVPSDTWSLLAFVNEI